MRSLWFLCNISQRMHLRICEYDLELIFGTFLVEIHRCMLVPIFKGIMGRLASLKVVELICLCLHVSTAGWCQDVFSGMDFSRRTLFYSQHWAQADMECSKQGLQRKVSLNILLCANYSHIIHWISSKWTLLFIYFSAIHL